MFTDVNISRIRDLRCHEFAHYTAPTEQGVSYIVIKTIKGRRYAYEQRTWREGKRVRTESRYLGPAAGVLRPKGLVGKALAIVAANMLSDEERGALAAERFAERVDAYQRELFGETAAQRADREREAFLNDLHGRYGLTVGPRNSSSAEKPAIDFEKESPSDVSERLGVSDARAPDDSE
jgi:hypothetical protein